MEVVRMELVVIGTELAAALVKAGFRLKGQKRGKHTNVYYFEDSYSIRKALELELKNIQKI